MMEMMDLERLGSTIVRLRDHSYRWIDTKAFRRRGQLGPDNRELLRALLAHPAYRDHYASPDSETDAPIHGPYRVDAVLSTSSTRSAQLTPRIPWKPGREVRSCQT